MVTLPFMPNSDDDKADLVEHIATNLPRYADLLEISPNVGGIKSRCGLFSQYAAKYGCGAGLFSVLDNL